MTAPFCLYYLEDDITLFFTLYPLVRNSRFRRLFKFTTDLDYVLNRSRETNLILVRYYKRRDIAANENILKKMRDRFEKVIYIDDTASADELNTSVFPYVDCYLKKQIQKDRSVYLKPSYGKRAFSHYYHHYYNVADDNEEIRPPLAEHDLNKISLLWNLGIGCYPKLPRRNGLARRIHPFLGINGIKHLYNNPLKYKASDSDIHGISARYGMKFNRNTVAFHREIYDTTVKNCDLFLTGRIPLKDYNRELTRVKATFSPFGWGEICFRDFEAIINKSALVKPSMDHIVTWPDIYKPDETYWPVDWDGKDLESRSRELLESPEQLRALSGNALSQLHESYDALDERVEQVLLRLI